MKATTARITAIAASAALALTGCGAGSQAADPTPTSPASTRAPGPAPTSPATTTPPRQSSARAAQEAAAITVVRAYVDEYNKALQSGSTTAFRATFKESCAFCFGDANRIDATFRKDQRLRGLQFAVASLAVTFHDNRQIFVEGQLSQAGGKVLTASGSVLHNITPTPAFRVLWRIKPGTSPVIFESQNL